MRYMHATICKPLQYKVQIQIRQCTQNNIDQLIRTAILLTFDDKTSWPWLDPLTVVFIMVVFSSARDLVEVEGARMIVPPMPE